VISSLSFVTDFAAEVWGVFTWGCCVRGAHWPHQPDIGHPDGEWPQWQSTDPEGTEACQLPVDGT